MKYFWLYTLYFYSLSEEKRLILSALFIFFGFLFICIIWWVIQSAKDTWSRSSTQEREEIKDVFFVWRKK
jgi:lysylphosphatidylglycerol synthetase-like protein (DUF2156 family)